MNGQDTSSLLQEADKDQEIAALKEALAEKSEEIKRLNKNIDQMKREEVLTFDKWAGENGYIKFADGRPRWSKGFASFATDLLYDVHFKPINP